MAGTANASCESCRFYDEHHGNGAQAKADEGLCRFKPAGEPARPGHQGSLACRRYQGLVRPLHRRDDRRRVSG